MASGYRDGGCNRDLRIVPLSRECHRLWGYPRHLHHSGDAPQPWREGLPHPPGAAPACLRRHLPQQPLGGGRRGGRAASGRRLRAPGGAPGPVERRPTPGPAAQRQLHHAHQALQAGLLRKWVPAAVTFQGPGVTRTVGGDAIVRSSDFVFSLFRLLLRNKPPQTLWHLLSFIIMIISPGPGV